MVTLVPAPVRPSERVQVMGIINRTPDSFSDGGRFVDEAAARAHADRLARDGADIIDIGAESTRPGAAVVSDLEQIARLGDLVPYVVAKGVVASVDTTSPRVAEHALAQGARMINSVSLEPARELAALVAAAGADLVLMHSRGSMADMAGFGVYRDDGYVDVVKDVISEWRVAARRAMDGGLDKGRLVFDPGLGFSKNARHSLELCARLGELKQRLGVRVLVGPSRKSYIAQTVAADHHGALPAVGDRLGGTIAAVLDSVARGADIVRVHDVAEVTQALSYARALADMALGAHEHTRPGTLEGGEPCSRD